MIEARTKANGGKLMVTFMAAVGLILLAGPPSRAAKGKERTISVTMNKGDTYTIDGLRKDASPKIKVVKNGNALVVNTTEPGTIVLVGADAGSWKIEVTLASGEKVTYAVNVNAIAPPQGSLVPGSAPTVMR